MLTVASTNSVFLEAQYFLLLVSYASAAIKEYALILRT